MPIVVADIPETGAHYEITADAAAREAIAREAGLRTVLEFNAVFDLTRRGEGVAVKGEVRARVGQNCVVTLDPIENNVLETVDLIFAPATATDEPRAAGKRNRAKGEPPEPLKNGVIDLAALATEFLILGIDPYPRKPGAEFGSGDAEEGRSKPFAALAALKKPRQST